MARFVADHKSNKSKTSRKGKRDYARFKTHAFTRAETFGKYSE